MALVDISVTSDHPVFAVLSVACISAKYQQDVFPGEKICAAIYDYNSVFHVSFVS